MYLFKTVYSHEIVQEFASDTELLVVITLIESYFALNLHMWMPINSFITQSRAPTLLDWQWLTNQINLKEFQV